MEMLRQAIELSLAEQESRELQEQKQESDSSGEELLGDEEESGRKVNRTGSQQGNE